VPSVTVLLHFSQALSSTTMDSDTVPPIVPSSKHLILCFDGTGNKFQGNASDSNIVKIFSLLDREDANQC
jgi:uncharacterized protein (DUF2235 family)